MFVQVSEWAHWWVVCIVWDQRIVPPTYSSFWLQNTFLCSHKGFSLSLFLFVLLEAIYLLQKLFYLNRGSLLISNPHWLDLSFLNVDYRTFCFFISELTFLCSLE